MSTIEINGKVRLVLWRQQVQPDLAVLVDDSLCIVLECGLGEHTRYVTLSDCDAVASAMNLARVEVRMAETEENEIDYYRSVM